MAFSKEMNQTLDLEDGNVLWDKEQTFSFNVALNETEYFSFERDSKGTPTIRSSTGFGSGGRLANSGIANIIFDTFRRKEKDGIPVIDLARHDTSDI